MNLQKDRNGSKTRLGSMAEKAAVYLSLVLFATVFLLQQMMAFPAPGGPSSTIRSTSECGKSEASYSLDIPAPHRKGLPMPFLDMEVEEAPCDDSSDGPFEFHSVSLSHQRLSEIAYLGFVNSRLHQLTETARNVRSVPRFVLFHSWKCDIG